jgi:hypothetical protein
MGARIATRHHDPAALTAAGMRALLMRGGELRHRPGPREGCSATSAMPKHPAVAAGIVSPPSGHGCQRRLRVSAKSRQSRLRVSAKGKQHRLRLSAKRRQGQLRASVGSRQPRLRVPAKGRQCRLQGQAAASLSPVLAEGARSRPGQLQAPLVATGEPMRPEPRASAGRPAARAV